MRARLQTSTMLRWWHDHGIDRADLAVRRESGEMIWHLGLGLEALPLAWARAENVRRGEVYARPARGGSWPVVFLDDVEAGRARKVARKYDALIVRTSPAGGCHLWIACACELDETQRAGAQRWLAAALGSDRASTSGEHLGRLAGFKNWKRAGTWVNLFAAPRSTRRWHPILDPATRRPRPEESPRRDGSDTSSSGQDWARVCAQLEAGHAPSRVLHELLEASRRRGKPSPTSYARRTIARARRHVQDSASDLETPKPRERRTTPLTSWAS